MEQEQTGEAVAEAPTRVIPLAQLRESPTNPRQHYDERALHELAASIRESGLLQPILVRPIDVDLYEIVAGHRRYRASGIAGLERITCVVRELSDGAVRGIQLIENGQRVDLSPIEEAEAYAALAAEGMDARAIAAVVKKKPSVVAARLALASLTGKAKKELAAGVLPVGHAELIARIPDPELQDAALAAILTEQWLDHDRTKRVKVAVAFALAKRIVQDRFMLALSVAPFDTEDETLSALGKCSTCRFRSGNNRDLFNDVKGKDVCMNPVDFLAKVQAWLERKREQGHHVLTTPEELRAAFPSQHNPDFVGDAYVDLEQRCYDDVKQRPYGKLLGKAQREQVILAYHDGRVRQLYPKDLIRDAIAASGHTLRVVEQPRRGGTDADRELRAKQRVERAVRTAVIEAYVAAVPKAKVAPAAWIDLLATIAITDQSWRLDEVLPRHGYTGTKQDLVSGNREKIALALVAEMTDGQKRAFVIDIYIHSWFGPNAYGAKRDVFKAAMALVGVDVKAIEQQIKREVAAKARGRVKPARTKAA